MNSVTYQFHIVFDRASDLKLLKRLRIKRWKKSLMVVQRHWSKRGELFWCCCLS